MAWILNIETATKACSVALAKDGKLIVCKEIIEQKYSHAEKLHQLIEEVITEGGIKLQDIEAIAVGKGPGSYTGLRIGVSAAKGLAYGLGIPLIAVSTLRTMAVPQITKYPKATYYCPMLDARRMEVYSMLVDKNLTEQEPVDAIVLDKDFRQDYLKKGTVVFFGDGAPKWQEMKTEDSMVFDDSRYPSSRDMVLSAEEKFIKGDLEDLAYFEPFYLKDFVAGKPKKLF